MNTAFTPNMRSAAAVTRVRCVADVRQATTGSWLPTAGMRTTGFAYGTGIKHPAGRPRGGPM